MCRNDIATRVFAAGENGNQSANYTPFVVQRVERTTSIYNRVPQTNNFDKGMEIVDSTSSNAYVHLSRDAEDNEHRVNIQQQPNYFNGLIEPTKRSRVDEEAAGAHVDLARYTRENNAHVTLEGRYAFVMSQLVNGFPDLDEIKGGAPVVPGFANLNFGSYEDHGNTQVSQKHITNYISDFAEQATELVSNRAKEYEGQTDEEYAERKQEVLTTIDNVERETADFANQVIENSDLNDLDDADFVHYGGQEWDPIIPNALG